MHGRRCGSSGQSHGSHLVMRDSSERAASEPPCGEKRTNDTHCSTTDPDARLFRKGLGKEAKLCHMGHVMVENRNNLIVDARLTEANGNAELTTAPP
jgi:hypothetical protein